MSSNMKLQAVVDSFNVLSLIIMDAISQATIKGCVSNECESAFENKADALSIAITDVRDEIKPILAQMLTDAIENEDSKINVRDINDMKSLLTSSKGFDEQMDVVRKLFADKIKRTEKCSAYRTLCTLISTARKIEQLSSKL